MAKQFEYDVVIIGGGPNGLLAGSYLSRAGLKVIVLERRHEMGGGAATEDVAGTPGFRINSHAQYMMMTDYAPVYKDLELETKYGLRHIYPSLQFAMPLKDGRCLCLYSDVERSCESIANFSPKDAETYREISAKCAEYMEAFIGPATYVQPKPPLEQAMQLEKTEIGKEISAYTPKSPKQVVDELFEDQYVKTLMLHNICMWGLDPEGEGVGYLIPLYLNRMVNYRMCVSGSHALPQALIKVILENKGHLVTSVIIKRIIMEGGRAAGVECEDGRIYRAKKAVVSTIDPHQTFLELVGEEHLDKDFVESIKGWEWEHWSFLGVHLALEEAPRFRAAEKNEEINKALVYVLGFESPEEFIEHYKAIGRGECPLDAGYSCSFPSVFDPLQAPEGKHTGSLYKMAPYDVEGDSEKWFSIKYKDEHAAGMLNLLREYAPNITDDKIRNKYVSTPAEISVKFFDMKKGSIKQGAYTPFQMGYNRPNAECSTHRSPVEGLYMGGACTYPGGTILLGSGYLAADAVVEDLGIEKWWKEPEIVIQAREKGLL